MDRHDLNHQFVRDVTAYRNGALNQYRRGPDATDRDRSAADNVLRLHATGNVFRITKDGYLNVFAEQRRLGVRGAPEQIQLQVAVDGAGEGIAPIRCEGIADIVSIRPLRGLLNNRRRAGWRSAAPRPRAAIRGVSKRQTIVC